MYSAQSDSTKSSHVILPLNLWWKEPVVILFFCLLSFFYLTYAAIQNSDYMWGPYKSPMYAAPYVPNWFPFSPAFLLLWIPAGFRLTCYYGRKAYYRAAFLDPVACAIKEPFKSNYKGETRFPYILQNLHRYFLYFALLLLILHWFEFFQSMRDNGNFYFGIGNFLLFIDVISLSLYVFSCHSFRHLIGGKKDCFSRECGNCRYKLWEKVSFLNQFHNVWFWISLYSIIAADLYIRLLAIGLIKADFHVSY